MSRKRILMMIVALAFGWVLFYLYAGHQTPEGQPPLAELNPLNFASIENVFNAARDEVRVLLLLSPT